MYPNHSGPLLSPSMETRLTESSAGDGRVIGLSISATIVRGVSVIADERAAPSVRAVAESDIDAAADTSLAVAEVHAALIEGCLLYTSPSPRDLSTSRMPSSA